MFHASNGLKQGCCLSPILSNIFQNDLHEIFDGTCDPLLIGSTSLNSLSWADDLVLSSLSENGLKSCIRKLEAYCVKWGLEVNVNKTKIMILGKTYSKNDSFKLNGMSLENVKTYQYLGLEISYNGNIKNMITDRIKKAQRVSNMVLQALKTDKNISSSLATSIFEKQIAPILLYGCPIWCLPKHHNLIYIEEQPEQVNTRSITDQVIRNILGHCVPLDYVRRVGKINNGQNRKILVKLKNYEDKEAILRSNSSSYIISNFEVNGHTDIHKMHMDFCKKALNVSKFCSISAVSTELGLFPLDNQAYSLTVKYWLRLVNSTDNELLNECYIDSVNENYEWLDGIRAILSTNGFGYVWNNPLSVNKDTFHKIFRQRLHDQYIQDLKRKIESSN